MGTRREPDGNSTQGGSEEGRVALDAGTAPRGPRGTPGSPAAQPAPGLGEASLCSDNFPPVLERVEARRGLKPKCKAPPVTGSITFPGCSSAACSTPPLLRAPRASWRGAAGEGVSWRHGSAGGSWKQQHRGWEPGAARCFPAGFAPPCALAARRRGAFAPRRGFGHAKPPRGTPRCQLASVWPVACGRAGTGFVLNG